jgi:tetratricopeptide (TPR) repeat protein
MSISRRSDCETGRDRLDTSGLRQVLACHAETVEPQAGALKAMNETSTQPASAPAADQPPGPDVDTAWIRSLRAKAHGCSKQGEFDEAVKFYRQILVADPGDAHALKCIGIIFRHSGDNNRAAIFLEKANAASPADGTIKDALIDIYADTAAKQKADDLTDQAIATYRKLRRLDPDHTGARINLCDLLAFAGRPATLSDIAPAVSPDKIAQHLLVACMPKSGSTFFTESLINVTGWKNSILSFAYRQNEQELYLPDLLAVASENTVTQQHCRATTANIQIIQAFGIRPIVLVRNLYDTVISLADFYDLGAIANTFFHIHWGALDRPQRLDAIIDHVVPWYLAFYTSWIEAAEADHVDCVLLTFEQMIADKPGTLKLVCDFLDIEASIIDCREAVTAAEKDAKAIRRNEGIAGRGTDALSDEQ